MDSIQIEGGICLYGQTKIQGSKNATLPILAATVLIDGTSRIENCPDIADVSAMINLLRSIGCIVTKEKEAIVIDAAKVVKSNLPQEEVTKMRSSIMLMGALIGRTKSITLDYPGGCIIGKRPVDIHLMALRRLGVQIEETENTIHAWTTGLRGSSIFLPFSSVGATENCILAGVCAEGVTHILNAAREPEIDALCEFLIRAGACIEGAGTTHITIMGVEGLHSVAYRVPNDRIVAGTYALAGVICGGEITLLETPTEHMQKIMEVIRHLGATIWEENNRLIIRRLQTIRALPYLKTEIYPGFPTDLQSMLMVACTSANGRSIIEETIFENRYKIVKDLCAMGADIEVENTKAYIGGKTRLQGKHVIAEELRGGAALVLAGMAAKGTTVVENKYFIDRGYENICADLSQLGSRICVK